MVFVRTPFEGSAGSCSGRRCVPERTTHARPPQGVGGFLLQDGGVFVKDLSTLIVKGVADLRQVMEVGQRNRSVASTLMNNESSRSHSIFTITIETAESGADGKDHIRVGKTEDGQITCHDPQLRRAAHSVNGASEHDLVYKRHVIYDALMDYSCVLYDI